MGRKLGYTFWDVDWAMSEKVAELNLSERGLYRELIDLAMRNNNKTELNSKRFSRKWNETQQKVDRTLNELVKQKCIEIIDNVIIVPSVYSRLKLRDNGSKGGIATAENKQKNKTKGTALGTALGTESDKLNLELRTYNIEHINKKEEKKENEFLEDWFNIRSEIKKGKTFKLNSLPSHSKQELILIHKNFSREDIKLGLRGLFRQETFPNNQDLTTDPTHFLKDEGKYISKYIQAANEQNKNIWGTNK